MNPFRERTKYVGVIALVLALFLAAPLVSGDEALAQTTYTADVVLFDTGMMFNRLGAQNPNWMMYALRRDVVHADTLQPETEVTTFLTQGMKEMAMSLGLRVIAIAASDRLGLK